MDKYKPGDVFISSLTQKVVIVEEDKKRLGLVMCEKCIYYEHCCSSEDISNLSNRREESGFCSGLMREDNKSIFFKEYNTITIPESVLELIKEIESSIMSIDEKDQYKLLLLNSIRDNG